MKYLSLQQAMLGMRVVLTDTGVLLKSPAGSAEYNRKGRRIKVNGHADYFPDHLRVKDKRSPKGGYVQVGKDNTTVFRGDGSVAFRLGCFDKAPTQSDEQLMKCNDAAIRAGHIDSGALTGKANQYSATSYSVRMGINVNDKRSTERDAVHSIVSKYLTGEATEYTDELVDELMSLCRAAISIQHEGKPSTVEFKADRFAIHKNAQSVIDNAKALVSRGDCAGNAATAWRLSDQMHEAILKAVRESDLFKSLVQSLDAQAASIAGLQQAMHDVVNNAISNAVKPGGLLWRATR